MPRTQEADAQGPSSSSPSGSGASGSSAPGDRESGRGSSRSARRRTSRRRYLIWALLVILVLAPFVILDGPLSGWLRDLGVLDREEQFTELYFPDRRALPVTVPAGAPISFDFALHNLEGEATDYRWKAVVTSGGTAVGGTPSDLGRGHVRLENGEVRRIHVAGGAPTALGRAVVQVELVARTEAIDFPITVVALADGAPAPTG